MKKIIVTTSWDDGHQLDIKLAGLLKKYGIRGTFYISPRNREFARSELLTDAQIIALSNHFEIGAHTMTHPILYSDWKITSYRLLRWLLIRGNEPKFDIFSNINDEEARLEIKESKKYLENLLGKEIVSFCYPDGRFNAKTQRIVKELGFKYARTVERFKFNISNNRLACGTTIHTFKHYQDILQIARFSKWDLNEFLKNMDWEYLAKAMFDYVLQRGGIFHLWGHSWEIEENNNWGKLDRVFAYIVNRNSVDYLTNGELVTN